MNPEHFDRPAVVGTPPSDKVGIAPAVRDRVRRLFEFLKRFEQRRSPVRRRVEESEWQLFFSELPRHPSVATGRGSALAPAPDGVEPDRRTVVTIKRASTSDCPAPQAILDGWLLDGWRDPDGPSEFRKHRPLPDGRYEQFGDNPLRTAAATEWIKRREQWTEAERPARASLALYNRCLSLWARLQREGEALRVLLGDGHLLWLRKEDPQGPVRHPLILLDVELLFDERKRELSFVETTTLPFLYADLLSTFEDLDGERRKVCRNLVDKASEEGTCHPLGAKETDEVLNQLAAILSASDQILGPEVDDTPGLIPKLQRDPVIFVIPRKAGIRGACEAFLERLPHLLSLPVGISLAVGLDSVSTGEHRVVATAATQHRSAGSTNEVDLFFTKPANEAQERIAQRLDAAGAVLVQGPPGTGKTHTIANLIGHLLAQGKSVLVTAQTSKALRVVREKVVDELKPLCVSVLDSDLESRAELEHAVNGIVAKLTSDPREFERKAAERHEARRELKQRIVIKERELRTALTAEVEDIVVAGRGIHPSEAARQVARGGGKHDWLCGPLVRGAPLPLSETELADLYKLTANLRTGDEEQILAGLPPEEVLIRPDDFRAIVEDLNAPLPSVIGGEPWRPSGQTESETLGTLASNLRASIGWLEKAPRWTLTCVHATLVGGEHKASWEAFADLIEATHAEVAAHRRKLLDFEVSVDDSLDEREGLSATEAILAHLETGGTLSWFARIGQTSWTKVLDSSTVNGQSPRTRDDVDLVQRALRIRFLRRQLLRRWDGVMAPAGMALDGQHRGAPEEYAAAHLAEIRLALRWSEEVWPARIKEMQAVGIPWARLLIETTAKPPHAEVQRLVACANERVLPTIAREQERLRRLQLSAALAKSRTALAPFSKTPAGELALHALDSLNPVEYGRAVHELARLYRTRQSALQRQAYLKKLREVAPEWATRVRERKDPHGGPALPGNPNEAWLHRQLVEELDRRAATDADALQRELSSLNDQAQLVTRTLVENLAWSAQARRTNPEQHRALMAWLDLVNRIGKGMGKRANEFRLSAQRQLDTARAAVPVWIMPLSRVSESFLPGSKLFDVVILDEASQCDMAALIAFALGHQVVVVGDDEQVSPIDIGQTVEEVRALQEEWLDGFRDQDLFDGRASAYEIGRRSFPGGLIRLVEHFRCVPDVIAFSNSLSYKNEIRPLRESSSAKVFPAFVAHRVSNGERSKNGKINRPEALELVSLVVATTRLPEYAGLELGIISLLGEEQARETDALLQRLLDPVEYKMRRLVCGTAAQFQGDERDVMFLSMVDSPADGPLRLVDRDDVKKRYNVAASRARDQVWVVYSLDPDKDLKTEDLRRRLLLHALHPSEWRQQLAQESKVESEFERQVLRDLYKAGYLIRPQVEVGAYRLDLVAVGKARSIAIECDGDRFHSLENLDKDLARQAILERLGWRFIRIRGSAYFRNRVEEMKRVFHRLEEFGIEPQASERSAVLPSDANELRERVVRVAADLRREWLAETDSIDELFGSATPVQRSGATRRKKVGNQTAVSSEGQVDQAAPTPVAPSGSSAASTRAPIVPVAEVASPVNVPRQTTPPPLPSRSTRSPQDVGASSLPRTDKPAVWSRMTKDPDPLPEAIAELMPSGERLCGKCQRPLDLRIDEREPSLTCGNGACGVRARISTQVLRSALSHLAFMCDCGAPVRVVEYGTARFVGCSTYP